MILLRREEGLKGGINFAQMDLPGWGNGFFSQDYVTPSPATIKLEILQSIIHFLNFQHIIIFFSFLSWINLDLTPFLSVPNCNMLSVQSCSSVLAHRMEDVSFSWK